MAQRAARIASKTPSEKVGQRHSKTGDDSWDNDWIDISNLTVMAIY